MVLHKASSTMNRRSALILVVDFAASFCLPAWAAGEKGWFGFSVSVDADGFSFNPTLRAIKIQEVVPTSPAAAAGLASGDFVIEVQGIPVAGAKADTLKAAMQKAVGETLHLRVKRGSSEAQEVSLVAAIKSPT
jgi:C-terminal processing protease CtpA/Prc